MTQKVPEKVECAACHRTPGIVSYGSRRAFKWHNASKGMPCTGSDLEPAEVMARMKGGEPPRVLAESDSTSPSEPPQETPQEPVAESQEPTAPTNPG